MTRRSSVAGLAVLLGLLSASGLWAISVRPVNLVEMVGMADRIFFGRCLEAREGTDEATGLPVTVFRFHVLEALKGVEAGEIVEFRQVSSTSQRLRIPGLPTYRKGQSLLMFLGPDSRLGLTSPAGLAQGLFFPERLESGELGFRNALHNQNLTFELEQSRTAASVLGAPELAYLNSGEAIPLSVLRNLVNRLDRAAEGGDVR
jgi:hypothetical protein